jgi:hypothetical protein
LGGGLCCGGGGKGGDAGDEGGNDGGLHGGGVERAEYERQAKKGGAILTTPQVPIPTYVRAR